MRRTPCTILAAEFQHVRYAWRRLRNAPGFTAIAIAITGLGIGVNTAIFSVINTVLFRSLPYENPSEIVRISTQRLNSPRTEWTSFADFQDYRDRSDLFSTASLASDAELLSILTGEGSEPALGEFFSEGFLSLFDFAPALGRTFYPEEYRRGSAPVVIISYAEWQRMYGRSPAVLGQTVRINGFPVTVVGVGPKGFTGTAKLVAIDYWMPWGTALLFHPTLENGENRRNRAFRMFARLKPRITVEQVRARLSTISSSLAQEYPETNKDRRALVVPATDVRIDPVLDAALYRVSAFLMILVGLVLLVACSNLAGMLLLRASSRSKDVGIRLALGASRGRVIWQLLIETGLLGLLGGAAGLLIALWFADVFSSLRTPLPIGINMDLRIDARVFAYAVLLSVLTGILVGLAPALKTSRRNLVSSIKDEAPSLEVGRRRFAMRNLLVVVQVAISLTLLVGAGLFIRTLAEGREIDIGFDTDKMALASVDVSLGGYRDEEAGRAFIEKYRQTIASTPGVRSTAIASRIPLGVWGSRKTAIRLPEAQYDAGADLPEADFAVVTREYFDVMGIPIQFGRNFGSEDARNSPRSVIVSQYLARKYWGTGNAVGKTILLGSIASPQPAQVVGVARNTKVKSLTEDTPYLYLPWSQVYSADVVLIARTEGDPAGLKETLRHGLHALDARVPLFEAKTIAEHVGLALYVPRTLSFLLALFGALTLVLAMVGLYGLVAFSVSQRTREIGIRMALGGQKRQVILMLIREGVGLIAAGLALGIPIACLAAHALARFLINVSPLDPAAFLVVTCALVSVALIASYIPARRAAMTSPARTLRHE
jgi:predicted permease